MRGRRQEWRREWSGGIIARVRYSGYIGRGTGGGRLGLRKGWAGPKVEWRTVNLIKEKTLAGQILLLGPNLVFFLGMARNWEWPIRAQNWEWHGSGVYF